MAGELILHAKLGFPTATTSERSADQWLESSQLNAERTNEKRLIAVPTKGAFSKKIADASSAGYCAVMAGITPNPRKGLTAKMICDNQRDNLVRSYDKWKDKSNDVYATVDHIPAKRYKDAVSKTRGAWATGNAERNLRAVGTKADGLGTSVIAPYWLTAHRKASSLIRQGPDEVIFGAPYNIVVPGFENAFVAMLTNNITKSLTQALKSHMDIDVVKYLNDRLNGLCQSMVDPALNLVEFATGADSHCDIINDEKLGERLEIKVSKK